ncbi:hypothetical protein AJ80_01507 [Polytolypa hystricis UAMH7299]|uniref:Uncharacterized protein n=1 Tax=Polytolypa hystricis (strain UAMH7299) TaxID=1447883 RepID=A0A2B7Z0J1_POLH7|nr:hypothetical protein AJ80_01507 [Polytolypa hystricis UAMH7299]
MSIPKYTNTGPVDTSVEPNLSNLAGKSVIVTGGASGLGKAYVEVFVAAGAYVTMGDLDETEGKALAEKYPGNAQFLSCDVCSWQDQVALFEAAASNSPHKSCDIVIANAGICTLEVFFHSEDDPSGPPTEPSLNTIDVNLKGVIYTAKLATHYFRRQPATDERDRCLILKSSLAGYVDFPGVPQYQATKFAVRGLMRSLRRMTFTEGIRVNIVAPWFIHTPLLPPPVWTHFQGRGIECADASDACKAMLRLACDKSINGRSLGVLPRNSKEGTLTSLAPAPVPNGYVDLMADDYGEGEVLRRWEDSICRASNAL